MSAPIARQASAVEAARRALAPGAMKLTPKEREYLLEHLEDASVTLRWVERHETAIRKRVAEAS